MKQLEFEKAAKLLEKYKIPFLKSKIVKTPENAVKAAAELKYPVVLKINSADIIHKSDIGGVKIANNETEIVGLYNDIIKNVKKKNPKAKLNGMIVQKKGEGEEVIIGMKRDAQFGPVIMFGLGGIFVEVLKDVSLRITPVEKKDAVEMISETKGYKILQGIRGKKESDIDAIALIITKISKLAEENSYILEIDFNPVIVDEKNAAVADIRVMTE